MCPHVSHGIVLQTKSSPAFPIECLVSISNGLNCNLCLENFCLGARFAFFFESGCFVVVVVVVVGVVVGACIFVVAFLGDDGIETGDIGSLEDSMSRRGRAGEIDIADCCCARSRSRYVMSCSCASRSCVSLSNACLISSIS